MSIGIGVPEPVASPAQATPALQPRIVWPGLARNGSARPEGWLPCDLDAFPETQFIAERRRRGEGSTHLPMFKAHVQGALRRVLIVDTYLLCGGEAAEAEVLSWFPEGFEAAEVRIACGGVQSGRDPRAFNNEISAVADRINTRRRRLGTPALRLETKLDLDSAIPPFVHDRFAVVDDELWHFGATVGGLHHKVNAATRGWDAVSAQAERFFNEVWRQRADRSRGARTACGRGNL